MRDAGYWIKALDLKKHPEGGYFRETYRSRETVAGGALPPRFAGPRSISTAIYYLLSGNDVSTFHRIKSDELWHFYAGTSLTIHVIDGKGLYSQTTLGEDHEAGQVFQTSVLAGCWFGATIDDRSSYSLVGCTVAPGFEFSDFEIGNREELTERYPEYRSIIEEPTRIIH